MLFFSVFCSQHQCTHKGDDFKHFYVIAVQHSLPTPCCCVSIYDYIILIVCLNPCPTSENHLMFGSTDAWSPPALTEQHISRQGAQLFQLWFMSLTLTLICRLSRRNRPQDSPDQQKPINQGSPLSSHRVHQWWFILSVCNKWQIDNAIVTRLMDSELIFVLLALRTHKLLPRDDIWRNNILQIVRDSFSIDLKSFQTWKILFLFTMLTRQWCDGGEGW